MYKRESVLENEMHKMYFEIQIYIYILKYKNRAIGLMSRVFANGPEDWGSIPGRVVPKTQKIVLDAALFKTQRIKGKVDQSTEWSSILPYTSV